MVRPGFIVGPGDPSERFTYWPACIDKGGEVLAPGDGSRAEREQQVLAEWNKNTSDRAACRSGP